MCKTQLHKEKVEQNIDDEVAETIRKNTLIVEEFRKINWTHHFLQSVHTQLNEKITYYCLFTHFKIIHVTFHSSRIYHYLKIFAQLLIPIVFQFLEFLAHNIEVEVLHHVTHNNHFWQATG